MHPLDSPIWSSLTSRHAGFAQTAGGVRRYPAEVAPFVAVEHEGDAVDAALAELWQGDERLHLLGPVPAVDAGWSLRGPVWLAQMDCPQPLPLDDGPVIVPLAEAECSDVLALAALVYPHYFRPRTMDLGRYFGIYEEGRLAAMIGERMATDDWQEISAVCTHPGHLGRGHARRLLAFLSNDVLAQGRKPFLHVSQDNDRAFDLYRRNGYRLRREIAFWSLQRAAQVKG